ncbi:MAG TPA: NYN domain-containing protein, partial [Ktedonobacterales bacterium]
GRTRTPQLVTPVRGEADEAAATEGVAPAAAEAPPASLPAIGAQISAHTPAADGSADAPSFEAHSATRTPDQTDQVSESAALEAPAAPAAAPVRRYRFDRPNHAATAQSARPTRQSPATAVPAAGPTAPALVTLPRRVPVTAPSASATAPTGQTDSAGTTLADELALPPALPQTPVRPVATAAAEAAVAAGRTAPEVALAAGALPRPEDAAPPAAEATDATAAATEAEEAANAPRRRRRRRGNGSGTGIRHLEAVVPPDQMTGEAPTPLATRASGRPADTGSHASFIPAPTSATEYDERRGEGGYGGPDQPYELFPPQQPEPWNVASAYQQIGQTHSPFTAPEPTIPRGFGPQPQGVAGPISDRTGRATRGERATDTPPMSANQLGAVLSQAIQQQTDRLLTELRHTQAPPSMTVMFPPLPSTERIGVFVDVANLLYAARSLRMSIDFGHLLEFLRGNRRLIRAHAYAPTSPEPNAEQQFLSVVKGVGYRITTKHYKTFSSGAKKADLDLDMCMDIVRLVDAKAVDTVSLVSGDSDFLPLLEYCSDHGVRVEVAAFDDSAALILRQSCDLFINLSLVPDIRA